MKNDRMKHLRRLVIVALFTALAYVVMIMIHFPVPPFLTLDLKDAIITLCGLAFGPLSALFISVAVPLIEMVTISGTGLYGCVMNILGSASLSVTVSLIYKYKKNFTGAIIALVSGICAMTAVMLVFNLIVTPRYLEKVMEIPFSAAWAQVKQFLPTLLLPFNLVKATLNSALVLLLYKPTSSMLQRTGFLPKSEHRYRMDWRSVTVMVIAVALVVASFIVIFQVLGGRFTFGVSKGQA